MNRSPLHDVHVKLGAKMVDFAGWHMPLLYRGIIEEHQHTRNACSLFDVSHMGRLKLTGADAGELLQRVCTRNLADIAPGVSRYSHVCREDGGILDDVIVSRYESHWLIVCNASNREKTLGWLQQHAAGRQVEIADLTMDTAMLALQGPRTVELAERLAPQLDLKSLKRFHFAIGNYVGMPYTIFRSGYTGEDGFEVIMPAGIAKLVASELFGGERAATGEIMPAGLGARDTLRMEAAMPLYGHELTEQVDSLTAGQGWCVDLTKEFIGADAMRRLKERGLARSLVGLKLEGRRIARQGARVLSNGAHVGEVTSGTLSPTLGQSIAMAFVGVAHAVEATPLAVEIAGSPAPAAVVKLPFYKRAR